MQSAENAALQALKEFDFGVDDIKKMSEFFSLIHKSPNRVRLRVNPKIKNESNADKKALQDLLNALKARQIVRSVKLNVLIGSLTIEYDESVLGGDFWQLLCDEKDFEAVFERLKGIIKAL